MCICSAKLIAIASVCVCVYLILNGACLSVSLYISPHIQSLKEKLPKSSNQSTNTYHLSPHPPLPSSSSPLPLMAITGVHIYACVCVCSVFLCTNLVPAYIYICTCVCVCSSKIIDLITQTAAASCLPWPQSFQSPYEICIATDYGGLWWLAVASL